MHDLVMMRGEASELAMWRKHLSTSERIRIDKKNHELGLYLIDALPKQVCVHQSAATATVTVYMAAIALHMFHKPSTYYIRILNIHGVESVGVRLTLLFKYR